MAFDGIWRVLKGFGANRLWTLSLLAREHSVQRRVSAWQATLAKSLIFPPLVLDGIQTQPPFVNPLLGFADNHFETNGNFALVIFFAGGGGRPNVRQYAGKNPQVSLEKEGLQVVRVTSQQSSLSRCLRFCLNKQQSLKQHKRTRHRRTLKNRRRNQAHQQSQMQFQELPAK